MADNVINGEGRPRFMIPTEIILDSIVSTASDATSITLSGTPDLTQLDAQWGLNGFVVWTINTETPAETTNGKIISFSDSTDVLNVLSWSNGTPKVGSDVYLQSKRLDLPYCHRLQETWRPDFIVKKMIDGTIRRNKRGYYYSARLDYTTYLHKDNLELLTDLFDNRYDSFLFYPRADNWGIRYEVDISPSSAMSFHQLKHHQGHGGVFIEITGLRRLSRIPLNDIALDLGKVISDDSGEYITDDFGEFVQED